MIKSDPDDNKLVDCAVVANAKFIVTEDRHYNILKLYSFPKVDFIGFQSGSGEEVERWMCWNLL